LNRFGCATRLEKSDYGALLSLLKILFNTLLLCSSTLVGIDPEFICIHAARVRPDQQDLSYKWKQADHQPDDERNYLWCKRLQDKKKDNSNVS